MTSRHKGGFDSNLVKIEFLLLAMNCSLVFVENFIPQNPGGQGQRMAHGDMGSILTDRKRLQSISWDRMTVLLFQY